MTRILKFLPNPEEEVLVYNDFFGLKENPFNMTPDPRFIYFSKKHLEAYASLLYGIEQRKGFLEITGDIGAGKTTLCRRLLEELKGRAKTSYIFNSDLTDTQLLQAIVEDFGVVPKRETKKGYFDAFNQFLLDELRNGGNVVLIIDEAQNLKPRALEQIRLLSNLETEREKLLQIVLVGQPELRETLMADSLIQLRQRISIRYHLTALDREEIENYIRHRLTVAGFDRSFPFLPDAMDVINTFSHGVPRLINVLCDKALLAAYAQDRRQIGKEIIDLSVLEIEAQTQVEDLPQEAVTV